MSQKYFTTPIVCVGIQGLLNCVSRNKIQRLDVPKTYSKHKTQHFYQHTSF
ncbi:hypothetical protein HanPI659440_Chr01g0029371 [Helianthus annuus]|nr:hypothetical protein HanPI659440_Chr01g0029371 [Helianthus annuus]KAJ0955682.1 hypothetical protein HanPSC8_Chr01g0005671 [Helianthus annuus]